MGEGGRQGPRLIGAGCCNHIWLATAANPTSPPPTHPAQPGQLAMQVLCPPAPAPFPLPHLTLPGSVGS